MGIAAGFVQTWPKLRHNRWLKMFQIPALSGEDIRTIAATFHAIILGSSAYLKHTQKLTLVLPLTQKLAFVLFDCDLKEAVIWSVLARARRLLIC